MVDGVFCSGATKIPGGRLACTRTQQLFLRAIFWWRRFIWTFFFFETMRQREPLSSPGDTSFNPLSFRQAARDRHFALGVAFVRFENQSREQSLQRSNRRARQGSSQASHHRLPQSPFMYVNSFEYMRLNWAACLVRNQTSYSLRITSRSVSPVEDEAARRGTSLESCI